MGLSLKQALPPEEKIELDWQIAPSSEIASTEDISAIAESVSAALDSEDEGVDVVQEAEAIVESIMGEATEVVENDVILEEVTLDGEDEAAIPVEINMELVAEPA